MRMDFISHLMEKSMHIIGMELEIQARDVTLSGLSTSQTIWGFTKRGSNWVILTRETGTNTIGMVREYSATGTAGTSFSIDDSIPSITGETFRAPKGLAISGNHYYVRVVRSVTGNMRLVKYTLTGTETNEDIVLASSNPTALSDMVAANDILYILHQHQRIIYATRLSDSTHTW